VHMRHLPSSTAWTAVLLLASVASVQAQTATTPGGVLGYSTIYSIGIEWDIAGDSNHDAVVILEYRAAGAGDSKAGGRLVRIDYEGRNMLAGSLLFLTPDTQYDIRLSLHDADGGEAVREIGVRTRPVPVAPAGGRVHHVIPGSGGGDGSSARPFLGVQAAQAM